MWTQPRATFHGKYFHVEDAILEPKPFQKPHPPIMVGGSGENYTLKVLAREGDACNLFGDPDTVKHKLGVLRRHCEERGRDFNTIERTSLTSLLLARDEVALTAKRERMSLEGVRANLLTVNQAVDALGRYQDVGVQLVITGIVKNDQETLELLANEVITHVR